MEKFERFLIKAKTMKISREFIALQSRTVVEFRQYQKMAQDFQDKNPDKLVTFQDFSDGTIYVWVESK